MIHISDAKLKTALDNLKKNPNLSSQIAELECAEITVQIIRCLTGGGSQTEAKYCPYFMVFVDAKSDAEAAVKKWGINGTTEENSLAHELGHVYWNYLRWVKNKPNMLDGKPAHISEEDWDDKLSETTARQFDTFSRPVGTAIPIIAQSPETVLARLDFMFPFSLMK